MLEITTEDFNRFLSSSIIHELTNEEWMERNGFTEEVITSIGESMSIGVIGRMSTHGESIATALYNVLLTTFQMGWEAHREFGRVKR